MEQQTNETFSAWAIVEVFGHNVFAGFVSERTIGGAALIQVDVPAVDEQHPAFTKLFGSAAIYSITPTTEAHAREAAGQIRVRPVTLYILPEPKRLPQMSDREQEEMGYAPLKRSDMDGSDDRWDDDEEDD